MIEINCQGGRIGRFRWENSDRGGIFRQSGESCTTFRPGRCGWDEAWPDCHSWPVSPWGKGDAADDYFRDFNAFEPWFDRQVETRKLDLDLNITEKIKVYSLVCGVFNAGIDAGRNPWSWAHRVEQQQTRFPTEEQ
jgi:hypothetical protein